jgi:crossover junction endodeoxyribonuclease RuvC
MITLGIDPGTALLGYGVVSGADEPRPVAYGVIRTTPDEAMPARLLRLYDGVRDLIATHQPDVLALEALLFGRNVTTAIAVGQARGVVLLAAAQAGVPVTEYRPAQVKEAVVGYGKADKPQMQEMVRLLLGLADIPRPDDAADALAIAICHVHTARFHALLPESPRAGRDHERP